VTEGWALRPRDVVEVTGSDAPVWLQGQLSQDLDPVADGETVWSLVLQPQGKLDALVRVTRVSAERFLLDLDGGWGDALLQRLLRFKLRVKAEVAPLASTCVAVRSEAMTSEELHRRAGEAASAVPESVRPRVLPASWGGVAGVDLMGEDASAPTGLPDLGPGGLEALRIRAGEPVMGAELDGSVIAQEAGLAGLAVSFTKGCFTGQELVARIDTRGHVNRHLRHLRASDPSLEVGMELEAGGKVVGRVTSAVPDGSGSIGLGYVRREIDEGEAVSGDAGSGAIEVSVGALAGGPR